jgi:Terminase large subunit, T4likevirus-type, N-terminal
MATATERRAGLVQACDDARLFGFPLWERQREILSAVEAGPRLHVMALGRRSGKSTMCALIALHACTLRPELSAYVRPGESHHAVCVSTSLRQSRIFVRAALAIVERSPLLSRLVESTSEDEIVFSTGAILSGWPCTSRGARGFAVSTAILDEAAHHVDNEGNIAAESIFRSLAPSTSQFQNEARLVLASTPFGSSGFFADTFTKAEGGELSDARGYQFSTEEMNPTIAPEFLEQEQARDPDGFKSEYLGRFEGSGGQYLDPEVIRESVKLAGELPPTTNAAVQRSFGFIGGFDASFASDPAGLCIVGVDPSERTKLGLALCRAWAPPKRKATSFDERRQREDDVLREVAEVCLAYHVRAVTIDQFASVAVADSLRRRGLTVKTVPLSARSKSEIFGELRARLLAGSLELFDDPDLLRELQLLRVRYSAGSSSVVTPRTGAGHCDRAVALALSVWAHRHGSSSGEDSVGFGHVRGSVGARIVTTGGEETFGYGATL